MQKSVFENSIQALFHLGFCDHGKDDGNYFLIRAPFRRALSRDDDDENQSLSHLLRQHQAAWSIHGRKVTKLWWHSFNANICFYIQTYWIPHQGAGLWNSFDFVFVTFVHIFLLCSNYLWCFFSTFSSDSVYKFWNSEEHFHCTHICLGLYPWPGASEASLALKTFRFLFSNPHLVPQGYPCYELCACNRTIILLLESHALFEHVYSFLHLLVTFFTPSNMHAHSSYDSCECAH